MKYKVRIKRAPMQKARTGAQVDYGLSTPVTAMGGADYGRQPKSEYATKSTIGAIDREDANLEAESGEIVFGDINGDTFPETNKIVGKRHSEGGVPLNLPSGTFIFSDTKSMKIKDCEILKMFNKPCGKRSYTPAKLAQVFDINAYREILQDPNSDKIDIRTAERMIRNYTVKLGALALAQESLKGFPDGIPEVAKPYMEVAGISEADILPPPELTQTVQAVEKDIESKQPGNPNEQTGAPNQDMMASAEEMNQGNPVAAPMNPQGQPSPMAEPGVMQPQDQMMRFGGNYSGLDKFLGRAQEGMQQPSPEEMMMMEQQAMQEQAMAEEASMDQAAGQDEMMQLVQGVMQALEAGMPLEELTMNVLSSGIPPELLMQVLAEVGIDEREAMEAVQNAVAEMSVAMQEGEPMQEEMAMEEMAMMQDGGSLPSYQSEGEVVELNRGDFDTEKEYTEALEQAELEGKKIVDKDGRIYNPKGKGFATYDAETMDPEGRYAKMFGKDDGTGKYVLNDKQKLIAAQSFLFHKSMEDPDVLNMMVEEMDKAYVNDNAWRKNSRKRANDRKSLMNQIDPEADNWEDINPAKKREYIKNVYLKQSDQALLMQAKGIDTRLFDNNGQEYLTFNQVKKINEDYPDRPILNPVTGEAIKTAADLTAAQGWLKDNAGLDPASGKNLHNVYASDKIFTDITDKDGNPYNPYYGKNSVIGEQIGQVAIHNIANNYRDKVYEGDKRRNLIASKIVPAESGTQDENWTGNKGTVSRIDNWEGNTDLGMGVVNQKSVYSWDDPPKKDAKACLCKDKDGNDYHTGEYEEEGKPCKPCPPIDVAQDPPAKAGWWLQDTINTMGAFGDASFAGKGMMPFHQQVELANARATYLDPTKQAADIQSQYAQNLKTAASFAGPQALGSTMSRMAGDAASKSTGVINQIGQQNVGLANQFALKTADTLNQQNLMNTKLDKTYFDELATKDARDRQEKLAARINRRKLYTTAIGNRAQTQALNTVNQEYNVDPTTGGFVVRTNTTRTPSGATGGKTKAELIDYYVSQGYEKKDAINAANSVFDSQGKTSNTNAAYDIIKQNKGYGTMGLNPSKGAMGRYGGQMPLDLFVNGGNVYPF